MKNKTDQIILCLVPDCGRDVYARGLCTPHYNAARRLVITDRTSWEKLEKAGKCQPAHRTLSTGVNMEWFLS